jgi:hypothetical protein
VFPPELRFDNEVNVNAHRVQKNVTALIKVEKVASCEWNETTSNDCVLRMSSLFHRNNIHQLVIDRSSKKQVLFGMDLEDIFVVISHSDVRWGFWRHEERAEVQTRGTMHSYGVGRASANRESRVFFWSIKTRLISPTNCFDS